MIDVPQSATRAARAPAHFPAGKLRRNVLLLLVRVSEWANAFSLFIWCAAGKINNPLEERDIHAARCAPQLINHPPRDASWQCERETHCCMRALFDSNALSERESNCTNFYSAHDWFVRGDAILLAVNNGPNKLEFSISFWLYRRIHLLGACLTCCCGRNHSECLLPVRVSICR